MTKKMLLAIGMMVVLAIAVGGCATKSDLQEAEARLARMEKALVDAEKKLLESVKAYGTEVRASKPVAASGVDTK